jgi:hypothetical protein
VKCIQEWEIDVDLPEGLPELIKTILSHLNGFDHPFGDPSYGEPMREKVITCDDDLTVIDRPQAERAGGNDEREKYIELQWPDR